MQRTFREGMRGSVLFLFLGVLVLPRSAAAQPDASSLCILASDASPPTCDAPCFSLEVAVEIFLDGNPTGPGVCPPGFNTYLYELTHLGGAGPTIPDVTGFEVEGEFLSSAGFIPGPGVAPSSTAIFIPDVVSWEFLAPALSLAGSSDTLFICSDLLPGGLDSPIEAAAASVGLVASGTCLGPPPPVPPSQTVGGKRIRVQDRSAGASPEARRVYARAQEAHSGNTIVGDPTVDGATLEIVLSGAHPSSQTFDLPAGPNANGRSFWRAVQPGFIYRDRRGENGPVTKASIFLRENNLFSIQAKIEGSKGALDLVPPDHGTEAFLVLTLNGGNRYCVKFGGDGKVQNRGARLFQVLNPTAEGCPP